MWLILAMACKAPASQESDPAGSLSVDLVPPVADFGGVALGEQAVQDVRIGNTGASVVHLSAIAPSSDALTVSGPVDIEIEPGESTTLAVSWSPTVPVELSESLQLVLDSKGEDMDVRLPVTGTASGPLVSVSESRVDVGTVTTWCSGSATLTISNSGTAPLIIQELTSSDPLLFSFEGLEGPTELPWMLYTEESQDLEIVYTPNAEGVQTATVRVTSNDPFSPTLEVAVTGTGQAQEKTSIAYDFPEWRPVTVLFALNANVSDPSSLYYDRFITALPIFFDALQAAGGRYRIAFLTWKSGTVIGSVPYIDDTMSTAVVMEAVYGMLADSPSDNDHILETLSAGIAMNRAWLLDEDATWLESRLSLVGANEDVENGDAYGYVNEYQAFKSEDTDVVVDGIAGEQPRGCDDARPSGGLYEATEISGGIFLSICEADWEAHMHALVDSVLESPGLLLPGGASPSSIEVWIDEEAATTGWSYDAEAAGIVFESPHYPAPGSRVRIDYTMLECPV